jgi:hypothetical protein
MYEAAHCETNRIYQSFLCVKKDQNVEISQRVAMERSAHVELQMCTHFTLRLKQELCGGRELQMEHLNSGASED